MKGRYFNLYLIFKTHSCFDWTKTSVRNNSNKQILFSETLKNSKNKFRDVGGYNMIYDDFIDLCRKCWEKDFIYFYIDRSEMKTEERCCICNRSKNTYIECSPETKPFLFLVNYTQIVFYFFVCLCSRWTVQSTFYGPFRTKKNVFNKKQRWFGILNLLASLQIQIKALILQGQLRKQKFHGKMKNPCGPVTDTMKDTVEDVTQTMTVTSKKSVKILTDKPFFIIDWKG